MFIVTSLAKYFPATDLLARIFLHPQEPDDQVAGHPSSTSTKLAIHIAQVKYYLLVSLQLHKIMNSFTVLHVIKVPFLTATYYHKANWSDGVNCCGTDHLIKVPDPDVI